MVVGVQQSDFYQSRRHCQMQTLAEFDQALLLD
jgi:hypothetical protein